MKKFATTFAVIASIMSTTAMADTTIVKGEVTAVWPVMKNYTQNIASKECNTVQVPIYGTTSKKNNTGEMIIGGIIGGVIGNQIGKGGGKEAATGIGALTGAIIAGENGKEQVIIGYRQEQQCTTVYTPVTETHIVGYNFEYRVGRLANHSGYSTREVRVGQTVRVQVNTKVVW